jgi:hypothetical protein
MERCVDWIPFSQLRVQHNLAIALILREKPHILSALDLYKAGCSIKELQEEGNYSDAEMIQVKGIAYHLTFKLKTQSCAIASLPSSSEVLSKQASNVMLKIAIAEVGGNLNLWSTEGSLIYFYFYS